MNAPDAPFGSPEINRLQRWFQSVITHPDGAWAGLNGEEAQRLIQLPPGELEQVITRSRALSAAERLAIYAHAYHTRLLECLGEVFPMLKCSLGEDVFNGFAFGYLQDYPSRSYTLNELGRHFARYLEETRPAPDGGDPMMESSTLAGDWPDLLIDLARLEWAIYEVFDGPGVEGQPLLEADQLLELSTEQWPDIRLEPVPCLHLLATRFPVNDYYTALRLAKDGETVPLPASRHSFVALSRREFVVRRYNLSWPEFELLGALKEGQSIGQAIERVVETAEDKDINRLTGDLRLWFRTWTAEGFFQSVAGH
jgi:Putative DNA-binding domain